jgi:hypothetical protein
MPNEISVPLVSLLVGLIGSACGVFIGIKIGIARLETWRDICDVEVARLKSRTEVHGDDLLIHDMEIGTLMQKQGMERIRRQVARG